MAINLPRILLPSAARTADATAGPYSNPKHRGLHVVIDVTAAADTPSVVPHIQAQDPATGTWYDILVGAAITGAGTTVLKVYPGLAAVANLVADQGLPGLWRLFMDAADADSLTYSVGAHLLV
jgi:hypothetical protein